MQRGLTASMRSAAAASRDIQRVQAWAGQSAWLARAQPAGETVQHIRAQARALLRQS